MSFRLVPKSVTLNDLEPRNGHALHYFTEFGKPAFLTHTRNRVDLWRILCTSLLYFVLRVQCRRKVSSRLLSHLLMSFLLILLLSVLPVLLLSVMQCWCLWYR